ncbi:MAG TPA: hypothetical protein VK171_05485 [Fimbriimonas sp.]|nr:hypothetical protein [Fimbriimonas sp.]
MIWFLAGVVAIALIAVLARNTPVTVPAVDCPHCGLNDFTHESTGTYVCPVCRRRKD